MDIAYLSGSLLGVALLVALNLALFGRVCPRIQSVDQVAAALSLESPGFRAGDFGLSDDGATAVMSDARDGTIWLVVARGDGLVTRQLANGAIRTVRLEGPALMLRLNDFTFPRAVLKLPQPSGHAWRQKLEALTA